ncbi:MAG: type II 3-dehydroquinate dehydratase [Alphaproteobacteria bacterium]|jgi:3-dehydroquinate dehydratase II|nr:type II 3-dehydroquinate dehydratase [Alphaproteobacteria bacterium]MBU2043024.1 type II 3-dehydroquinate dehydratase [Alphaproteobacteria bacterium]MBU2124395.1 type II 3-dehydroquinate dehydratase [Alphaproteobacteria bacterium]MBU2209303.1 type II 3-dehydroquinate dehydratase [Alphaproteobacteria bacterium]MBU2290517.1 type II 3-dehydroquinate dehydratase [Alphaproteobacteria bacterium]
MPETLVIHVLNGPNLNLLGVREPEVYGSDTLAEVQALCERAAEGATVVFRQTNHEGELIDQVQEAREKASALVINAAGYTHTSVALLDALRTLTIPIVECHLSNPAARERFRHRSYISPVATGVVSGFGSFSYELAVRAALRLAQEHRAAADRSV